MPSVDKFLKRQKNYVRFFGALFVILAISCIPAQKTNALSNTNAQSDQDKVNALLAQEAASAKVNDPLIPAFWDSDIGKHLYENRTLSSPDVAAKSFDQVNEFCSKEITYAKRQEIILSQVRQLIRDPNYNQYVSDLFRAGIAWCSASIDFYRYAADPSHNIRIVNGKIVLDDVVKYSELAHAINVAKAQLDVATDAFNRTEALIKKKQALLKK